MNRAATEADSHHQVEVESTHQAVVEGSQLSLTPDPLADAIFWDAHNPEAACLYVQTAMDDVAEGRVPSSDYCAHIVRRSGLLSRDGKPVTMNDGLTSQLARLYKRRHGIPFQTRKAKTDSWGVTP